MEGIGGSVVAGSNRSQTVQTEILTHPSPEITVAFLSLQPVNGRNLFTTGHGN
jgi:hypothetical protein